MLGDYIGYPSTHRWDWSKLFALNNRYQVLLVLTLILLIEQIVFGGKNLYKEFVIYHLDYLIIFIYIYAI